MASATRTTTALKRWSVAENMSLPPIERIKALHVYDFDNTLFNSPLPNSKVWNGPTIGFLQTQETFASGGWWHDPRILSATGEGIAIEEQRAWKGWWNESIVQLIMLSMQQKDALTVLLTGRSEGPFAELIKKMVKSKGMEFDMIVLKPKAGPAGQRFSSTMVFKQVFLENLMETYRKAEEIRVYEDRVKHVKGFRDYFMDYNRRQNGTGGHVPSRGPITAEVIQVADGATLLDPVVEAAEVQKLINDHNLAVSRGHRGSRLQIKKTVFYTGYLITNADTQKLLTLAQLPPNMPETELKFLANNVLITPRPCPNSILEKVGGMGNKLLWEVTGTAVFENKIWAVSVRPVPSTAKYYTENPVPIVVLALRKGARPIDAGKIQNWQPVPDDKAFIFETTVGEKVLLRVEEEDPRENEYESLFPNKNNKRKHAQDDDSLRHSTGQYGSQGARNGNHGRGRGGGNRGNGGSGRGRGGNRGGNAGGRGRGRNGGNAGGGHNYRSLDDMAVQNGAQPGYNAMAYDDFPPLSKNPAQAPVSAYQHFQSSQPQPPPQYPQTFHENYPPQQQQQPQQQLQQQQYQAYPQYNQYNQYSQGPPPRPPGGGSYY